MAEEKIEGLEGLDDFGDDFSEQLDSFMENEGEDESDSCLLYTSPSPRDRQKSRMPSSA